MVDWQAIGVFYGLACLGAVLCGAAFWALTPLGLGLLAAVAMMWTPALAAVAARRWQGLPAAHALGLRWGRLGWSAAALIAPMGLYTLMVPVGLALPGVTWDPSTPGILSRLASALPPEQVELARTQLDALPLHPAVIGLLALPVAGATVNALFALGEELGWRGFLHDALQPLGFWRSNLLTGALWGLWHAPLILQGYNFPSHPVAGVALMVLGCMALSPIMGLFRERSDSVLSAALFHGALNAGGSLPILVFAGPELLVHPLGAMGIGALAIGCLLVAVVRRVAPA
ncbi:MAG: membrane protease YdiL (CAAX protease family) [Myxococcota bacterium]|jgi:membrane protease YdiL (CAAX protease family)